MKKQLKKTIGKPKKDDYKSEDEPEIASDNADDEGIEIVVDNLEEKNQLKSQHQNQLVNNHRNQKEENQLQSQLPSLNRRNQLQRNNQQGK